MPPLLLSFFTTLLSLLMLTMSTPTHLPRQSTLTQQYYLRTSVTFSTNDTGTCKDNLYLTSYHTGAGLSDAVFTPNVTHALSGYLNTTAVNSASGETQWITNITTIVQAGQAAFWDLCGAVVAYANWNPMTVNIGNTACPYFYADGDMLVYALGDWLVCDWWHGVPQLFYITSGQAAEVPFEIPSSCSLVELQMIPVEGGRGGSLMWVACLAGEQG